MFNEIHISSATQKRAMSVTSKVSEFWLSSIVIIYRQAKKKKNWNWNNNNKIIVITNKYINKNGNRMKYS